MKTSTFNSSFTATLALLFISTFFQYQAFGQKFPTEVSREGLVLDGKISSKNGVWSSDNSTIYTLNWVKPSGIYAGTLDERDSIPVLTQGGLTEEGLLVVSHSRQLYSGYFYLMALEPCSDCVYGMKTWRIKGSLGEFNQEDYFLEKTRWANKPKINKFLPDTPCQGSEEVLYVSFGNIYLTPDLDSTSGYIDIKTKTTENAKFLQSLASNLGYSSTIFGNYAITSHSIQVSPIGVDMQAAYTASAGDLTSSKASLSMTKNTSSLVAYSIETFFTPTVRITFKIPTSSLTNLPSELENLLNLESIEASYLCDGRTYPFREIIIVKEDIGVIIKGAESGIVYQFENVSYNSASNTYSFEIFASSSEDTYLNVANVKIDFSSAAFLPNQVDNGLMSVFPVPNGVLGFNNNYDIDQPQDLDASSLEVNMFAVNTDDFINLELLDNTPRPLFGVSLKVDDCEVSPALKFLAGDMAGFSTYFQPPTFPLPLVYDPVLALDQENTPPCGCDLDPVIAGFSPNSTPLVAGVGQVLTITGSNFGVYERWGSPGHLQTGGSSVMFKNGDEGPTSPLYIAASDDDIVSWTNTEIKVKIPSVGFGVGIGGTAASGEFIVRNRCGKSKISVFDLGIPDGELNISYSIATYRLSNDGPAKKLGLRNDNGLNGEQDGYAFAFSPDVTGANVNIDIKAAFGDALDTWCPVTNIRFKKQQADSPTNVAVAGDGVNSITIEDIPDPDAAAAMVQSILYFKINCEGSVPSNEEGGFILVDIDFRVDAEFAEGNDQQRAVEVLTHELGHAHLLNHALCNEPCTQPIMQASGGANVILTSDSDGANRVFQTSEDIINSNDCVLIGSSTLIFPVPIQQGGCGTTNPSLETVFPGIRIAPNPTASTVVFTDIPHAGSYSLTNLSGQMLQLGDIGTGEFQLDLSTYPAGTYFVHVVIATISGHFKIIKL